MKPVNIREATLSIQHNWLDQRPKWNKKQHDWTNSLALISEDDKMAKIQKKSKQYRAELQTERSPTDS